MRRLIEFLVKNPGKYHSYETAYNIYTGDEYNADNPKCRKRLTKALKLLCDYSRNRLKKYLEYVPGKEVALEIEKLPVCITYGIPG